ncbi:MAG: hypothetical protein COA73_16830 [Candidatus Hydrogenedentota bacterium]|nr:MAG: hypothetical protein COA73_16830 [Candidatus Hydrogenedentota bacterium]
MELQNIAMPDPVQDVTHAGLRFFIYATADEMGHASAIQIAREQVQLVEAHGETSLWLMAAPSAFPFYDAYIELVKVSPMLQSALGSTHFFQFDDYPLPADHPATFRYLLQQHLFGKLSRWIPEENIHALNADAQNLEKTCQAYALDLLTHGPDLQLKGMGENGHWGFHEPGVPLDLEPGFMEVDLSDENVAQQMRDHPLLFTDATEVPVKAVSANVALFMETHELIEDNVPQESKGFAFLASYGNEHVNDAVPSSALKQHPNAVVRTTEAAAREWLAYQEHGIVTEGSLSRMVTSLQGESGGQDMEKYIRSTLETMEIPIGAA